MTTAMADLTPPGSVFDVLDAFRASHDAAVRLWGREPGESWRCLYPHADGAPSPGPETIELQGTRLLELLLEVESEDAPRRTVSFLVDTLNRILRYEQEARSAAQELSERYEEINLLYTISEILASVISLDDAARRILEEVTDVLGARRGALWIHDPASRILTRAAAVGEPGRTTYIRDDDPRSVTARVFRERQPLNLERGAGLDTAEGELRPAEKEAYLSAPLNFTPPEGAPRTVGVITLVGQRSGVRFTAGDTRLLTAVASQVGAALETHRLVQESMRRERVEHEMELAHDLQLKLLPDATQFTGQGTVAARCVPAESVGGDLYNLFHLTGGRLGVVIGDVSSHGFSAALIMALTMSAIAIYAQEVGNPGEVLRHVHRALIDELESTEMYLTLVYAIVDPAEGTLAYANAGHPHAFRVHGDGTVERLAATSPPLGTFPLPVHDEAVTEWEAEEDLLVLFTDGLSDAFAGVAGIDGEQQLLDRVVELRARGPGAIIDQIFRGAEGTELDIPPDDRTAIVLRA